MIPDNPDNRATDFGSAKSAQSPEPPPSPPPRKGPPLWAILTILIVGIAAFAAGIFSGPVARERGKAIARAVSAATHDHGAEPAQAADAAPPAGSKGRPLYTCGMHPWVILPQPGLCPICHMDLTPLDPSKITGEVAIDPVITQNIGVRIAPVTRAPLERAIRTVGSIAYNESSLRDVNTKVEGWIEKVHVTNLGQTVRAGDPLFDLYSPDLYAAQEEYLLALRAAREIKSEHVPSAAEGAQRLLESARTRLSYFDVADDQLAELEAAGTPTKTLTIRSPHTGIVVEKHANDGMKIEPGMQVYRIADLSTVWVLASLYEYQLPFVEEGQGATMTLSYLPGRTFEGRIARVYPYLDPQSRQASVRLEFDNPDNLLKPGMYAQVALAGAAGQEATLAPRSAIIDTGTRAIAFVSLGRGKFDPRPVKTGAETGDGQIEILEGLEPGEQVVVSGQFLLDSEARMRESLLKMVKGDLASQQTPVAATAGASELEELPEPAVQALSQLLNATFRISETLASDSINGIDEHARAGAAALDALTAVEIEGDPHFWHNHTETRTIRDKAQALAEESDLKQARLTFVDYNAALIKLTAATGIPPMYATDVHKLHCPMYLDDVGAWWLQPAGPAKNPYYGSEMLDCYDERLTMPRTGASAGGPSGSAGPAPQSPAAPEPPRAPEGPPPADQPVPDFQTQPHVDRLITAYLRIHESLTKNSLDNAQADLVEIRQAADAIHHNTEGDLQKLAAHVSSAAKIDATDLKPFRESFKQLSTAAIELVRTAPPSPDLNITRAYCPMVKADWLQAGDTVANAYDPRMLRCGRIEERFPPQVPEAKP